MTFRVARTLLIAVCAGAVILLASAVPARADVITTFGLSGSFVFNGNPYSPLTGTVTIDTTTGSVTGQTLLAPLGPNQPVAVTQGYDSIAQAYGLMLFSGIAAYHLYFDTASLVGYAGGNLGSLAVPTAGGAVSGFGGQLAPVGIVLASGTASPVPEPLSAGLLLSGLAGMGMTRAARRRG